MNLHINDEIVTPGMSIEEYLRTKSQLREQVMTDDELRMTALFTRWYVDSHRSIQAQNLFETWATIDAYSNGEQNEPIYPEDTGTVTNVTESYIEGLTALGGNSPIEIQVKPVEPSDVRYAKEGSILLRDIKKRTKIQNKKPKFHRSLNSYGFVHVLTLWNPDKDQYGLPEFINAQPEGILYDPLVTDYENVQDCRYIIRPTCKSIAWAAEKFGTDKAAAIVPGYLPHDDRWANYALDEERSKTDAYIHMFVFCRVKGKVQLIQMSADGTLLADHDPRLRFPNDGKNYPISIRVKKPYKNSIYGKPPVSDLIPIQNNINDLDNQMLISARLTGNPQRVVDNNANIDVDSITNEPGLIIRSNDIKGIQWAQPAFMSPQIKQIRDGFMYHDRAAVTRFNDSMIGVAATGVDTATEADGIQKTGFAIVNSNIQIIDDLIKELLEYALDMCEQYWTTEMAFRITGEEDFLYFKPSDLRKIPILRPAKQDFIDKAKARAKTRNGGKIPDNWEQPKYQQLIIGGKKQYRKAAFDLEITVGPGIEISVMTQYRLLLEGLNAHTVAIEEVRTFMHNNGLLPYIATENEQERLAKLEEYFKAQVKKDQAAAESTMMNAEANREKALANATQQGITGMMQNGRARNAASDRGVANV